VYLAAKTAAFLDVFHRYPRKDKKEVAAQIWSELAETHPGGEPALREAILKRFDGGMLDRAPYRGPNDKRPCFDTFLAERRWEDPESAPDDETAPTRPPPESFRERDERLRQDRRLSEAAESLAEATKGLPFLQTTKRIA